MNKHNLSSIENLSTDSIELENVVSDNTSFPISPALIIKELEEEIKYKDEMIMDFLKKIGKIKNLLNEKHHVITIKEIEKILYP